MNRRWPILLSAFALIWAVALYWACLPPLSIERTDYGVTIHVERLGEYSSQLTELTVRDEATQSIVLRLVPKEKMIGMWALQVREGSNHIGPDPSSKDAGFTVQAPADSAPVQLSKGHVYEVTIRGFSMLGQDLLPFPVRQTARFVL